MGLNGSSFTTITGEDDTSCESSPFLKRGDADTLTALRTSPEVTSPAMVNINPLDEQQQQIVAHEENAKRRSAIMALSSDQRQYVVCAPSVEERLKEVAGRSLSGWVIGPRAPCLAISLREGLSSNDIYSSALRS